MLDTIPASEERLWEDSPTTSAAFSGARARRLLGLQRPPTRGPAEYGTRNEKLGLYHGMRLYLFNDLYICKKPEAECWEVPEELNLAWSMRVSCAQRWRRSRKGSPGNSRGRFRLTSTSGSGGFPAERPGRNCRRPLSAGMPAPAPRVLAAPGWYQLPGGSDHPPGTCAQLPGSSSHPPGKTIVMRRGSPPRSELSLLLPPAGHNVMA